MKNWCKAFIVALLVLNVGAVFSKTIAQECADRSMVGMKNAEKLGYDFNEQAKWGANAASHCFREFESKADASTQSNQLGGAGWLLLLGGFGFLYWVLYRPDVNGFRIPFVDSPEEKAEKLAEANKTAEEKERERKFSRTYDLRRVLLTMVSELTVEQIARQTESEKLPTVMWLAEENKTCRDFGGISHVTVEDLVVLTGASPRMILTNLSRRGMVCKKSKGESKKRKS